MFQWLHRYIYIYIYQREPFKYQNRACAELNMWYRRFVSKPRRLCECCRLVWLHFSADSGRQSIGRPKRRSYRDMLRHVKSWKLGSFWGMQNQHQTTLFDAESEAHQDMNTLRERSPSQPCWTSKSTQDHVDMRRFEATCKWIWCDCNVCSISQQIMLL